MEEKNLLNCCFRPIKAASLGIVQFDDTKKSAVQLNIDGFTTMPCDDNMYEERSYLIPTPGLAFYLGWNLIRGGIRVGFKNMFK